MALDGKVLRRALARHEEAVRRREEETRRLRFRLYGLDPRLRELDGQLRATVAQAAAAAVSGGGDPVAAVEAIQRQNLQLQAERSERIVALGYPRDCIDDLPACRQCNDRGYVGAKPCACLLRIYAQEQRKELSRLLDLQGERFEAFRLDYYDDSRDPETGVSPRQHMEMVRLACRRYAETFSARGDNLFLSGAPGLGKTFLSACIAGVVSDRGYSVVYDTAVNLLSRYEEARFGRRGDTEEAEADLRRYEGCDLLILDDLGTEMTTAFNTSVLYEVVNSRLRTRRSTVISSNLSIEEIGRRYSPQIASRLEGTYENLKFYGTDIRLLKKAEG